MYQLIDQLSVGQYVGGKIGRGVHKLHMIQLKLSEKV